MKFILTLCFLFSMVVTGKAQLYDDNTVAIAKQTGIAQIKGKFYTENLTSFFHFANGKVQMCLDQRENRITIPLVCSKSGNNLTLKISSNLINIGDNPNFWAGMNKLASGKNAKALLSTAQKQRLKNEQQKLLRAIKIQMSNQTMNWTLLRFDNTYIIVKNGDKIQMYMTKDAWTKYKGEKEEGSSR